MAAPDSARVLPAQTPNTNTPLCMVEGDVTTLRDSEGKPITGKVELFGYITASWRYLLGTFAQKTNAINPNFTLVAGASYNQAQQQALINQVALLSKQLGRTT